MKKVMIKNMTCSLSLLKIIGILRSISNYTHTHTHTQECSIISQEEEEDSSIDDSLPNLSIEMPSVPTKPKISDSTSSLPDLHIRQKVVSSDSDSETDDIPIPSEIVTTVRHRKRAQARKHTKDYKKQRHIAKKGRKLKQLKRKRIMHSVSGYDNVKYYDPTDEDEKV